MRKFFASLFFTLAITLLITLMLVGVIFIKLDSGKLIENLLKSQNVYARSSTIIADYIDSTGQLPIRLSQSQLSRIFDSAFTSQELEALSDQTIENYYSYLKGQTTDFSFSLNLKSKKPRVRTATVGVLDEYLASLPNCSTFQAANLAKSGKLEDLNCRPDKNSGLIIDTGKMADQVIDKIPDSYNSKLPKSLDDARQVYQQIYFGFIILIILTVILFLAALWLLWDDKRTFLRWLGVGFLVNGLPLIALNFVGKYFNDQLLTVINQSSADISNELKLLIRDLIAELINQLNHGYYIIGLILTIIGLAALVGSFFVHKKQASRAALDLDLVK